MADLAEPRAIGERQVSTGSQARAERAKTPI
jgi:hypothetical protein